MSAIKGLPDGDFWSLQFIEGKPFIFNHVKTAYAIYEDRVECLLSNEIISRQPCLYLEGLLEEESLDKSSHDHLVFHAFYELGSFWLNQLKHPNQVLGIWMVFKEKTEVDESFFRGSEKHFKTQWKKPSFVHYKEAFERGKNHLKRGDCYQYNLTFPFKGKILKGNIEDFIGLLWQHPSNRGAYAGISKVNDLFYYSNSPECLFNISKKLIPGSSVSGKSEADFSYVLETKPIKGTVSLTENEDLDWETLKHCPKNESELYMITDLLRNDLNGIEKPIVKVVAKKAPLRVPGLLHSYSHLEVCLSSKVTLKNIMKSVFPGGSITGAPKRRVMEIIAELEVAPRGFYCGSTILRSHEIFRASINIRGGRIDIHKGSLCYHAGSGVTYESTLEGEYNEMLDKHKSLTRLLHK